MYSLSCQLTLPNHFPRDYFFDFYQRDALQIAEKVTKQSLIKGLVWQEEPAYIQFDFNSHQVEVSLKSHCPLPASTIPQLAFKARHMLGLNQAIELFEAKYSTHPELGPLLQKQTGLRIPLYATPFEALASAIIGQQISMKAATSVRRKLIQTIARKVTPTLWCYPDFSGVASLEESALQALGFSKTKAHALITASQSMQKGDLASKVESIIPVETIMTHLLNIRGIGSWTSHYTLLRGFGWLDGSLHNDAGLLRSLQLLLKTKSITAIDAKKWLMQFKPWRGLVAAHLWAALSPV